MKKNNIHPLFQMVFKEIYQNTNIISYLSRLFLIKDYKIIENKIISNNSYYEFIPFYNHLDKIIEYAKFYIENNNSNFKYENNNLIILTNIKNKERKEIIFNNIKIHIIDIDNIKLNDNDLILIFKLLANKRINNNKFSEIENIINSYFIDKNRYLEAIKKEVDFVLEIISNIL